MNNTTIIIAVVLMVFVFLITYDPKSRRLEKYLVSPGQEASQASKASKPAYQPVQTMCETDRYYELQFNAKANGSGCSGHPKESMGAII